MTTTELSQATGVPTSTLKLWVREGTLRPAMAGYGRGESHYFDEDNVAQVRAILKVREWLGDGIAARQALEKVREVRSTTGAFRVKLEDFVLQLT